MNHNISNLIVCIKTAYKLHLNSIKIPKTKLNMNILFLLYKEGLIKSFFVLKHNSQILIYLKYINKVPLIFDIKVVSKPSKRVY
jgi:ribosomal protein S8